MCIINFSLYYYYHFTAFQVFPNAISRWFLTGTWVTASVLKSPELSPVFWPILIMLLFRWSPLVFLFPSPLYQFFGDCTKSSNYNWYHCHFHVPHSFFQFPSKKEELIFLFVFFHFYSVISQNSKINYLASSLFFFFFCWLLQHLVIWLRLGDPFVSQNPRGIGVPHAPGGNIIYINLSYIVYTRYTLVLLSIFTLTLLTFMVIFISVF